jgi:hypothetical protein
MYILGCAVLATAALLIMPRLRTTQAPSRFDEAVDRGVIAEREVAET